MKRAVDSRKTVPLEMARTRLVRIWFSGSALPFGVLVIQSILGKYESSLQDVWAWFVPTVTPTLSLMISVLGAAAFGDLDERRVRTSFLSVATQLSIAYLLVLSATILLEPFSKLQGQKLFSMSNYYLAPLQGLVVGALSVLFTLSEKGAKEGEAQTAASGKPKL